MKTLLSFIAAVGLVASTYAQEAKTVQHRMPDGQAIQITIVVESPQHQGTRSVQRPHIGPRMSPLPWMRQGMRPGFNRGPRGMQQQMRPTAIEGDKEKLEWQKTLDARLSETRHRLNPSGPYPGGRGFGGRVGLPPSADLPSE